MEFLSIFITWQFVLLCMSISAVTFFIRTIIEFTILDNPKMPGNSRSKFWRDCFLVLLPIVLGFLFPILGKTFPYPNQIVEPYSKFLFTSAAGLISPTLYRVIKALLWQNIPGGVQQIVQQINPMAPAILQPAVPVDAAPVVVDPVENQPVPPDPNAP